MNKKKKKLLIQNFLQANTIFLKWSLFIIKNFPSLNIVFKT